MALVLATAVAVRGAGARTTYADRLAGDLPRRFPEIISATIEAPAAAGARPVLTPADAHGRRTARVALRENDNRVIGVLEVSFRDRPGWADSDWLSDFAAITDWLRLVIPDASALRAPFLVRANPGDCLAQKLALREVCRHPEILVVAIHVTPPGGARNIVAAINEPALLGRDSDAVDTDTEKTSKTVVQLIPASHRMEVHMPLRDAEGETVGTICTVGLWEREAEVVDFIARSMAVRDEVAPRIPSYAALFRP